MIIMHRLIKQVSNESFFNHKNLTFYFGIDPTAEGIHVGHLLPLVLAIELINKGFKLIILIGGFTASIGDPTGKSEVRKKLNDNCIIDFSSGLLKDIKKIFQSYDVTYVNNADWLSQIKLKEFIELSYSLSVNKKLNLDTFATRLTNNQHLAMSEFLYSDLQAIDFVYLYDKYGCNVQIGGGDQWGNIAFGVHYLEKIRQTDVFGITTHLLTHNGQKVGKSIGKPPFLQNSEDLYDFCLRLPDESAHQLYYILFNKKELDPVIMKKKLIQEILLMYNGNNEEFNKITNKKSLLTQSQSDTYIHIKEVKLSKILLKLNFITTTSEAKRQIRSGAIVVNDKKCLEDQNFDIGNKIKIVFSKKKVGFVKIIA